MRTASTLFVQAGHRCHIRDALCQETSLLQIYGLRAVAALAGRPHSHAELADDGASSVVSEHIGPGNRPGGGGGGGPPARIAAPYRLRASDRDFDSRIVTFAERMFQSSLDDDEDQGEDGDKVSGAAAVAAPPSRAAAAVAVAAVAGISSSGDDATTAVAATAAAAYASTEMQRERRQRRLTSGMLQVGGIVCICVTSQWCLQLPVAAGKLASCTVSYNTHQLTLPFPAAPL